MAPVELSCAQLQRSLLSFGREVKFAEDTYGEKAQRLTHQDGEVLVLENVRFDKREKKNDPEIAKTLFLW